MREWELCVRAGIQTGSSHQGDCVLGRSQHWGFTLILALSSSTTTSFHPPPHSAPMRQPACQDAERAVLACDPRSDPNQCDDAVRAYVRCADALTFRLMNPGRE